MNLRRLVDSMLSIGSYPEETETQRGKRRIIVAAIWMATFASIPTVLTDLDAGYFWVAVANALIVLLAPALLFVLNRAPQRFEMVVNIMFGAVYALLLFEVTAVGGLIPSGLTPMFALIIALASLIAFGIRAATWWFMGFLFAVVYSVVIPSWVEPRYNVDDPIGDAAFNLAATGVVVFAVLVYFVRQRDRFQKESDDLLHNILPDEIATRLKASSEMIADSYGSASVLFADVVDFTPMSVDMSPQELVGLLNSLFSTFDRFVEGLELEKIKTVGDEYMVASGIPAERPDHAHAIAELALRMRDELETNQFAGRQISMRIGINSGPVVAGIIGTHKFAYDLWGDAVNTASRMESEGVEGGIQVSEASYRLIKDDFVCEPRGLVPIKGKGEIPTFLLVSRRTDTTAS